MGFCSLRVDCRLREKPRKWGRLLPTLKALKAPHKQVGGSPVATNHHTLSDLGQICLFQGCFL